MQASKAIESARKVDAATSRNLSDILLLFPYSVCQKLVIWPAHTQWEGNMKECELWRQRSLGVILRSA